MAVQSAQLPARSVGLVAALLALALATQIFAGELLAQGAAAFGPGASAIHAARSAVDQATAGVQVEMSSQPPAVGDHYAVALHASVPPDCALDGEPRFPVWGDRWGDAEVVTTAPPSRASTFETPADPAPNPQSATTSPVVAFRQALTLAAFQPGKIALPPVEVVLPCRAGSLTLRTASDLSFTVQSLLPAEGPAPDPRPPALPRQLPFPPAFWWSSGALALACLGAGILLWRDRRRRAAVAADLPDANLPPLAALAASLLKLREQATTLPAERLHTGLSLAVRRYLSRQLAVPALESSTSEIQRALAGRALPATLTRGLVKLLRDCDSVKFARRDVSSSQSLSRLDEAESLAQQLEVHLHPPEPMIVQSTGVPGPPTRPGDPPLATPKGGVTAA